MGKLEKKFGKYAIPGLIRFLILAYALGLIIQLTNPVILSLLYLNPYAILRGQIWRLITWIVIPPNFTNLFFFLLMCFFYYSIGTQLERVWGAWRFNVYLIGGILFTILGAFLLMGYYYLTDYELIRMAPDLYFTERFGGLTMFGFYAGVFSTYYVNMSLFLAYAATFPDMQVLLMFVLPIRVKWLGLIYGIMLLYYCIGGGIAQWVVIGSSLLNFLVFFLVSGRKLNGGSSPGFRKIRFIRPEKKTASPGKGMVSRHKCAICGRTELSNPELSFRFCSKCAGNYEYCQEHLFTHKHIG